MLKHFVMSLAIGLRVLTAACASNHSAREAGGMASSELAQKYAHVDRDHVVPKDLLNKALAYFDEHDDIITNRNHLAVIDFAKYSAEKRFFIINAVNGNVWSIHVAHGAGSDPDSTGYATHFSNEDGSLASSLGFYVTAETYSGDHGVSLRLDGLSLTNSNARSRQIVLHGADYVTESGDKVGRSWGCPAVAYENRDQVLELLQQGSLIFAGLSDSKSLVETLSNVSQQPTAALERVGSPLGLLRVE
jgi:hypothetical protein